MQPSGVLRRAALRRSEDTCSPHNRTCSGFSVQVEVVVHVRLVVDVLVLGDRGLGARGGVALDRGLGLGLTLGLGLGLTLGLGLARAQA